MGEENQGKENKPNSQAENSSNNDLKVSIKNKVNQIVKDPKVGQFTGFVKKYLREVTSSVLMLAGIVTFPLSCGGVLVACGLTVCYYHQLKLMVNQIKERFTSNGVFKNVILFGLAFFLCLQVTAFMVTMGVLLIILYFLPNQDSKKNNIDNQNKSS